MTRLVVTRLLGGLGNQLFQWAVGAAVARAGGAELHVDARLLPASIPNRLPELGLLAPAWRGSSTVDAFLGIPGLWRLCRASAWRPRLGRTRIVFDRLRGYDASLPGRVPRHGALVLTGYWQSPEWPAQVADALRAAVIPKVSDSIGLHVRRGDYASNARSGAYHGVLGADYYRRALECLGAEARHHPLLVFSDEPARVRAEGWLPANAAFAPAAPDLEHLRSMAGCAHLIVANSSFSWWAGWFGERPGRTVVAPQSWWTSEAGPIPHPAPTSWRRL